MTCFVYVASNQILYIRSDTCTLLNGNAVDHDVLIVFLEQ